MYKISNSFVSNINYISGHLDLCFENVIDDKWLLSPPIPTIGSSNI